MPSELMNADELRKFHVKDYGRISGGDGYDDMEINERGGWRTISSWGRDGWDMGDWPYVMISWRGLEVLSVCEGDHTVYRFANRDEQTRALNYLFCWYQAGDVVPVDRDDLDAGTAEVDPKFFGPYDATRRESVSQ